MRDDLDFVTLQIQFPLTVIAAALQGVVTVAEQREGEEQDPNAGRHGT